MSTSTRTVRYGTSRAFIYQSTRRPSKPTQKDRLCLLPSPSSTTTFACTFFRHRLVIASATSSDFEWLGHVIRTGKRRNTKTPPNKRQSSKASLQSAGEIRYYTPAWFFNCSTTYHHVGSNRNHWSDTSSLPTNNISRSLDGGFGRQLFHCEM